MYFLDESVKLFETHTRLWFFHSTRQFLCYPQRKPFQVLFHTNHHFLIMLIFYSHNLTNTSKITTFITSYTPPYHVLFTHSFNNLKLFLFHHSPCQPHSHDQHSLPIQNFTYTHQNHHLFPSLSVVIITRQRFKL